MLDSYFTETTKEKKEIRGNYMSPRNQRNSARN